MLRRVPIRPVRKRTSTNPCCCQENQTMSQRIYNPAAGTQAPELRAQDFRFCNPLISRLCTLLHVNKNNFFTTHGGTRSGSPTSTSRPVSDLNAAAVADQHRKLNPVNPEILSKIPRQASSIDRSLIDPDRPQTINPQGQSTSDRFLKLHPKSRRQDYQRGVATLKPAATRRKGRTGVKRTGSPGSG